MEAEIKRQIILDTETSGLDFENDRIIEIGCLELIDGIFTGKKFHKYYKPDNIVISHEAEQIHGLNNSFLSKFPSFDEDIDSFLGFIDDSELIIHNAQFDLSHLNNELKILGKKPILKDQVIDTLDIAREKFPGSQISLDALCKRFRVDNSKRKLHTALIDCELLSKVYVNLIDQKEPKLNFYEKKNEIGNRENVIVNFCKNVIEPTTEELKEHQIFLKKSLKKNYF